MSIRKRLLLLVVIASLVPLIAASVVGIAGDVIDHDREAWQRLDRFGIELARLFDQRLAHAGASILERIEADRARSPGTAARLPPVESLRDRDLFRALLVVDSDGDVLATDADLPERVPVAFPPESHWLGSSRGGLPSIVLVPMGDETYSSLQLGFALPVPAGVAPAGFAPPPPDQPLTLLAIVHLPAALDMNDIAGEGSFAAILNVRPDAPPTSIGEGFHLEGDALESLRLKALRGLADLRFLPGTALERTTRDGIACTLRPFDSIFLAGSAASYPLCLVTGLEELPVKLGAHWMLLQGAAGVLALVVVALLLAALLDRALCAPLSDLGQVLAETSADPRKLDRTVPDRGWDEVSLLVRCYNGFCSGLSFVVRRLHGAVLDLRWQVKQLIGQNLILGRRLGREVSALAIVGEEMGTFLEQEQQVAQSIRNAGDVAQEVAQLTRHSESVLAAALTTFGKLVRSLNATSSETRRLSEGVNQIFQDSQTLESIADRSRLLAVNVSIEVNRTEGKAHGVDIVAKEIHLLSEKTVEFTQRIRSVIARVLDDAHALHRRLQEEEDQLVTAWSEQSREARAAIDTIEKSVTNLASEVGDIARQNRRQLHYSGKVRRHLERTRRLVGSLVEEVTRNNECVSGIERHVEELMRELRGFKVGADELVETGGVDLLGELHDLTQQIRLHPPAETALAVVPPAPVAASAVS